MTEINLADYNYELPDERIAQYPVKERDMSSLLVYKDGTISKDIFKNIYKSIPSDSLLIFNDTRVIRARILFRKASGSLIEILCLEPVSPSEYELSFGSFAPVEWKCIVGNLKKWKRGIISTPFKYKGNEYILSAEKLTQEGDAWGIRFSWNSDEISFSEVLETSGHIPLPPYISRADEPDDTNNYQTVYSRIKGSVAAPTAGLHFTEDVLNNISNNGIISGQITLHVGAGTFKPIKSKDISGHEMHSEQFYITRDTIELLLKNHGKIIAVGTTSVRTLETLYWLGVKILNGKGNENNVSNLGQWDAYRTMSDISAIKSLETLLNMMDERKMSVLHASTGIIIIPGYKFRMINGMITNFHQPGSTLLLLISAWLGEKWKEIYKFALDNDFRFLSYGDSSLLLE